MSRAHILEITNHLSQKKRFKDFLKLILKSETGIESKNASGRTVLHIATARNYIDTVKILLKNGADIQSTDACGRTPLHIAAEEGHIELSKFLLKSGSDLNCLTKYNHVPLDFACMDDYSQWIYFTEYDYTNYFSYYSVEICNYNREEITNILKEHIVKLKVANQYVCQKNLALIGSDEGVIDFTATCEKEIDMLKKKNLTENITLYDIVRESISRLAVYVENKTVDDFLKSFDYKYFFPIYADLIAIKYRAGVARKDLLQPCYNFFQLYCKLPAECTDNILLYLSNKDIKVFVNSFGFEGF